MRVLNNDTDTSVKNISIYLTQTEARQMLGYLEQLLDGPEHKHFHLNDEKFDREITLTAYDQTNLPSFDVRSVKLIEQDVW